MTLSVALLIALGLGFVALFYTLNRAEGNDFSIADAFIDPQTTKASISRITTAIGCLAMTWLVIAMEQAGRTNDVIVGVYAAYCLGVLAVGRLTPPPAAEK